MKMFLALYLTILTGNAFVGSYKYFSTKHLVTNYSL